MNSFHLLISFAILILASCANPNQKASLDVNPSDNQFNEYKSSSPNRAIQRYPFKVTDNQVQFTLSLDSEWDFIPDSTGLHPELLTFDHKSLPFQFSLKYTSHSKGERNTSVDKSREEQSSWENALPEVEFTNRSVVSISKIKGNLWEIKGKSKNGQLYNKGWVGLGERFYYQLELNSRMNDVDIAQANKLWESIISGFEYKGALESLKKSLPKPIDSPDVLFSPTGIKFEFTDVNWLKLQDHSQLLTPAQNAWISKDDSVLVTLYSTHSPSSNLNTQDVLLSYLMSHGLDATNPKIRQKYLSSKKDHEIISIVFEDSDNRNSSTLKATFTRQGNKFAMLSMMGSKARLENYLTKPFYKELNWTAQDESINTSIATAALLNQIGLLKLTSNQPLLALNFFEKANTADPSKALYLMNCGFIYQLKNLHAPGSKRFEKQFELVKSHGKLLWIMGELYEEMSQYDQALDLYLLAIRFYPLDEELVINLSDAYWGVGYKGMSLRVVYDLFKKQPSKRLGIYYAKTLLGLERTADAIDVLYSLKRTFGLNQELGHTLLKGLLIMERYEEALTIQSQLVSLNGHDDITWFAKGKSEFYLKQFKNAEKSLRSSLKLDRSNDEAASLLAASEAFLGKGKSKALSKKLQPAFKPKSIKKSIHKDWSNNISQGARIHLAREVLSFKKGFHWTNSQELLIEILDSSGVARYQEINDPFIPGYDRLYMNFIIVYDSELNLKWKGAIKDFYVTTELGAEISKQTQLAHFPVKDLEEGDFIHLQLTRKSIDKAQHLPYKNHIASRDIQTAKDVFELHNPPSNLRVEDYGLSELSEKDNKMIWTFEFPPTTQYEALMPSIRDIASGITLAENRSWESIGREYENLLKHQYSNSITVKEKAYELRGNKHDPQIIVDSTINWIRRYIKYKNTGFGGSSLIPAKSSETLSRFQGDCKDQSLLLKEILAVFNLKSYLTLIHLKEPVSVGMPTIQQFNHMILYIPPGQGIREQYVDLTETIGTDRIIPYHLEGRNALLIDGSKSKMITTPILTNSKEHHADFNHQYFLNEDGSLEIKDEITLDGKFGALFREKLFGFTQSQMREYLRRWFSLEVPNIQVQSVELTNLEEYTKPFKIKIFLRSDDYWNPARKDVVILPNIWEATLMRLPQNANRLHPIRIPDEMTFKSHAKMKSPKDFLIRYPKTRQTLPEKTHYTEYENQAEQNENYFAYSTHWKTYSAYADPSEYPEIRNEWNNILNETLIEIQLEK